ncbi:MAG: NAD(P)-dependent oxidoreductase [Akkermansiaceae bacterium]|nr:NAD(P)-dependent oxidoreductase [Akkermansiaceae bacterium]
MATTAGKPRIAVLGMGIIGSRAAGKLAAAGFDVRTWNRTPREEDEPDLRTAAESAGLIAMYLKDVPAVRAVFESLRPVLGPGKVLLNHATIDLATTAFLEEECARCGCGFLNAPFTGSKVAAGKGELVYYVGGPAGLLEDLRPVLEATSREILPVGPPAAATILKLTTNLISACTVQALAEALRLCNAHGVDSPTLLAAVERNACHSVLAGMKIPGMAAGDFDPHFSLSNMLKDARYALDLAAQAGVETPGIATTADQMQALCDSGHGEMDFSVLYRQFKDA